MRSILRLLPLFLLLGLLLLTGCASTISKSDSKDPASSKGRWFGKGQEPSVFYHDFEDVLIPKDMKLVSKDSILFETPRVKTGVLVYEGRVDPVSLSNFFLANMPKDNWSIRSYFKYNRYIMVFEKPDKDCIITIVDKPISTQVEIWVAPRLDVGRVSTGTSTTSFGYPLSPGGQVLSD